MNRQLGLMQLVALTLTAIVLTILAPMTVSGRHLDIAVAARVRGQLRELATSPHGECAASDST